MARTIADPQIRQIMEAWKADNPGYTKAEYRREYKRHQQAKYYSDPVNRERRRKYNSAYCKRRYNEDPVFREKRIAAQRDRQQRKKTLKKEGG